MEMLTFKQFFLEKCWKGYTKRGMKKKGDRMVPNCVKVKEDTDRPVFSVVEPIEISGVGRVTAKVDSGNEAYNVLHGVEIKKHGHEITFNTVDNKTITKPIVDTITINIGNGIKDPRYVTEFDISVRGNTYKGVKFSISDRTENEEKVLIGEPFLRDINAVIDVNSD